MWRTPLRVGILPRPAALARFGGLFSFLDLSHFYKEQPVTQAELNREVAKVTGESVRTVGQRGFGILDLTPKSDERDREPLVVDWDELESHRDVRHPVACR